MATKSTTTTKNAKAEPTPEKAKVAKGDAPAKKVRGTKGKNATMPTDPHDWHFKVGTSSRGCKLCHAKAGQLRHKVEADDKTVVIEFQDKAGVTQTGTGKVGVKFHPPKPLKA
jgi:hypothetical protein